MIVTVVKAIPQTVEVLPTGFKATPVISAPMPLVSEVGLIGIPGPPGPPGPAGESMTLLEYIYNAGSPPPTGSQLRMDNSVQNLATVLYITKNTNLGLDPTIIIRLLDSNYRIVIQDKNDSTKFQRYNVVGTPTEYTTYFEIPVVWTDGGSPLLAQSVKLALISSGSSVNITVSDTAPSSPAVNDLWVDTT